MASEGRYQKPRSMGFGKSDAPGINSSGTGNEGVGEHVRTRFHLGFKIAGEIADREIRTERRKLISSAGPVFELIERSIQPFDLMSRRHPLSSTRAVRFICFEKQIVSEGSRDVPASSGRQFSQSEITSSS
jgi:hypothetical protein